MTVHIEIFLLVYLYLLQTSYFNLDSNLSAFFDANLSLYSHPVSLISYEHLIAKETNGNSVFCQGWSVFVLTLALINFVMLCLAFWYADEVVLTIVSS